MEAKSTLKERELMVDNILLLDKSKIVRVLWFKLGVACIMEVGKDYPSAIVRTTRLKPIELTEEWLLKLGFVKKMDTYYLNDLGLSWITTEDNFQTEYKLADSKWKVLDLKYVNQLQNLVFALTGEELTLTETPCQKKE